MKKLLKGYLLGFISATLIVGCITSFAANVIKIVIDGTEIIPHDVNGKRVDPILIDGTTYLPVRAVAEALGKEVYWDGPNYTVYLGKMDGQLQYPTTEMLSLKSIADEPFETNTLTDNYGNSYVSAISTWGSHSELEYLLNMKYSRFKATLYMPQGSKYEDSGNKLIIYADGKRIYTSPDMTKTSSPVNIDVNIKGCNNFKIEFTESWSSMCLGDAGFYQ